MTKRPTLSDHTNKCCIKTRKLAVAHKNQKNSSGLPFLNDSHITALCIPAVVAWRYSSSLITASLYLGGFESPLGMVHQSLRSGNTL